MAHGKCCIFLVLKAVLQYTVEKNEKIVFNSHRSIQKIGITMWLFYKYLFIALPEKNAIL